MANSKGSSNLRNSFYSGKHALLPPKSPFPSVSPAYADYAPGGVIGPKAIQKPREGNIHHQRTSSESSFLMEEQPSWLDDLLNEPETPVSRRGHRRSSSDSFACLDAINTSNLDYASQDEYRYKHLVSVPWGSQDFDYHKDSRHAPFYNEANAVKPKNRPWESPANTLPHSSSVPAPRENILQNSVSVAGVQEADCVPSIPTEKLETAEAGPHDAKTSSEKKDNSHTKTSVSESDTKRAKQQFAQRSRVRKLQYIAELERNVQALQTEGSEFSAELEFLNQQNLILSMENKALKQRLESLAQEQLIKSLEHEVLKREIGRLQAVYQQQQQQHQQKAPPPSSSHRRSNSRDLDSQFATLSLKHKDANSGHEPVTGPLRI